MGVPGCYPGRGRFESFPRRSDPLIPCSHAPGVSVGEGRQPFKLEVGGSIPLGSTRGAGHDSALPCLTSRAGTDLWRCHRQFPPAGGRRGGAFLRPQSTPTGVIARRAVSFPTTRGDRRVGALLRQELAGSNPVGGHQTIENIPDKESTWVLSTPDPAPTVFRSPSLITWPSSWSHTSPQEPEIRVRIPAVESVRPP